MQRYLTVRELANWFSSTMKVQRFLDHGFVSIQAYSCYFQAGTSHPKSLSKQDYDKFFSQYGLPAFV